jgi:putative transposase
MLNEAVEKRFGDVDTGPVTLEFLSDNGGAYRAHETHAIARPFDLTPIHIPVFGLQSNGMAESFVNTLSETMSPR